MKTQKTKTEKVRIHFVGGDSLVTKYAIWLIISNKLNNGGAENWQGFYEKDIDSFDNFMFEININNITYVEKVKGVR